MMRQNSLKTVMITNNYTGIGHAVFVFQTNPLRELAALKKQR